MYTSVTSLLRKYNSATDGPEYNSDYSVTTVVVTADGYRVRVKLALKGIGHPAIRNMSIFQRREEMWFILRCEINCGLTEIDCAFSLA